MNQRFLNKLITIKKIDNSWIKGKCIAQDDFAISIKVERESNKVIVIPYSQISEIVTGDESYG
jgi:hypothetical protein